MENDLDLTRQHTPRDRRLSFANAVADVSIVAGVRCTAAAAIAVGAVGIVASIPVTVTFPIVFIVGLSSIPMGFALRADAVRRGAGAYDYIDHEPSRIAGKVYGAAVPIAFGIGWGIYAGKSFYDASHKFAMPVQDNEQAQVQTQRNVCADPMIQNEIDRLRACVPS